MSNREEGHRLLDYEQLLEETNNLEEEPVSPPKEKSCCKSKSCSKNKQVSNVSQIIVDTPKPTAPTSSCCKSKSCSKNKQLSNDQIDTQKSSSVCHTPLKVDETKPGLTCCQSGSCSKCKQNAVGDVDKIQASSSCCKSKVCSKSKPVQTVDQIVDTEDYITTPTILSSSCCKSNTCTKRKQHVQNVDQVVDIQIAGGNKTILNLNVQKLHCSDCALMVEEILAKTSGIFHVRVMEMTNSARVVYDKSLLDEANIIHIIEKLGFPTKVEDPASSTCARFYFPQPVPQRTVFDLENMVQETEGVSTASYDFKKSILTIDYDPDITGIRTLLRLLDREGFEATVHSDKEEKADSQTESKIWQRNLFVCLALSTPVTFTVFIAPLIASINNLLALQIVQNLSLSILICWIFATPIQFYFGKPLYLSAYRALRYAKKPNMDTLVMLSTTTAYMYSVISVIVAMFKKNYKAETFFETSALLLTFIILGRYLEVLAKGQTSNILAKMMELRVTSALWLHTTEDLSQSSEQIEQLITRGEVHNIVEEEIDTDLVQRGDILKILPGAKVPTDGVVIFGSTSIDESMLSGESIPVSKHVNDPVYGSTINQNGTICIRVTKIASENALSAIDKLIHESQSSKVPIQRVADTISAYFVPVIMILSALAFIVWLSLVYTNVLKPEVHPVTFSLQFALAILVISCPCAISLAAPTAVMVGIGVGAKFGVLFKNGAVIETCHKVNTIIFDKTGTLTNGKPVVTDCIITSKQIDLNELLYLVGSAELSSEHVLGKAIVEYSQNQGISLEQPTDFTAEPGKGLKCLVGQNIVLAGNPEWMLENSIQSSADTEYQIDQLEREAKTVVCVAINGALAAIIALADTPKEEAAQVVRELKRRGIEIWVVSGDNHTTTQCIASQIGIEKVMGGVLPANKAAKVRELQNSNKVVAMVGDGINDAPSLAQANVGIAIGAGSDIAIETADIILIKSDLKDVLVAVDLSKTTFRRIKMNFVWAFCYNIIGIPLAAGFLYPIFKVTIPPALAGLSEIFSSIPVVLFSLLLKRYRPSGR